MKKRFLSGLLAFVMILCMLPTVTLAEESSAIAFEDVDKDAYYFKAMKWAVENGITNGTSATTFSPKADCSRGQIATFLWRAYGTPEPKSLNNPFTDVKKGDFYYDAVLWAVENGITNGTSTTTFSPDESCTRAQIITFLWRAMGSQKPSGPSGFEDVLPDDYFYDAVAWDVEKGITNGMSVTRFGPDDICTRAQIVVFLYRAMRVK